MGINRVILCGSDFFYSTPFDRPVKTMRGRGRSKTVLTGKKCHKRVSGTNSVFLVLFNRTGMICVILFILE